MAIGVWISLFAYFALMIAIGIFAMRRSTSSSEDYMLGGRALSPKVAALSAGASDMSGWLLLGLPGALYVSGLGSAWIGIGLFVGAFFNWTLVAPRLREQTVHYGNAITIPSFLANRFPTQALSLRTVSAIVIVIFFAVYTASGLVAGGKLFESAFSGIFNFGGLSDYAVGIVITLGVVLAYTVVGGFLAVSMTDFVQGCIMFVALVLVPIVAFTEFDSLAQMNSAALESVPSLSESWQELTLLGLVSSLAWGLGYFGQPHIIVRFMAIRSVKAIATARNIGMSWMLVTIIGALGTGFVGIAYANQFGLQVADAETIFIIFSEILFHPLISGFLMAAILAAIMSTISSQLLVSASSLTEDIYRVVSKKEASQEQTVAIGRYGVAGVALAALLLAWDSSNSILSLVSNAWAGFGAAFGPLVLFCLYKKNLTHKAALAGILSGAVTVLFWIYAPVLEGGATLSSVVYEIVPGFIISSLTIWGVIIFSEEPHEEVQAKFTETNKVLAELS